MIDGISGVLHCLCVVRLFSLRVVVSGRRVVVGLSSFLGLWLPMGGETERRGLASASWLSRRGFVPRGSFVSGKLGMYVREVVDSRWFILRRIVPSILGLDGCRYIIHILLASGRLQT